MKHLLFSINKNDFTIQTFCTGGNGGQHRNAKQNGVRFIHNASGARAEHRDGRDQHTNRIKAFQKCVETKEFKAWHKMEVARRLGQLIEVETLTAKAVDNMMLRAEDLKIEYF